MKTCKIFLVLCGVVLFLSFNCNALQMGASVKKNGLNDRFLAKQIGIKSESETAGDVAELSQKISKKMKDIRSLSFSFTQRTYIAKSTEIVRAKVLYIKPDKLHIKYTKPFEQEIIFTDGYLYTYVPEINQAIKQKKDNISDIAGVTPSLIFLSEPFKLMKSDFSLSIINEKSNFIRLKAVPLLIKSKEQDGLLPLSHEKSNFDSMLIFFDPDTLLIMKTKIIAANLTSETVFNDYKLNSEISFNFKLPDDVKIIEIK